MSVLNRVSAPCSSRAALAAASSFLSLRGSQRLLRGLVALHQAVHDRLQRLQQLALGRVRLQLHRHHAVHLEVVVVAGGVQLGAQVVDDVRVGGRRQLGRRVVGLEGRQDFLGVVHEIHHVGRVLPS
jgi:hypothetical protein